MIERTELEALPATAPWLLHSLRTLFDERQQHLRMEAMRAPASDDAAPVAVKFVHRCMEVTALYDRNLGRFTELRACDIAEVDWKVPTYCITLNLRAETEE